MCAASQPTAGETDESGLGSLTQAGTYQAEALLSMTMLGGGMQGTGLCHP